MKARGRAAGRFKAADKVASGIPLGQPILVGHHSEGRARRDQDRIHSNVRAGCAEQDKAECHDEKADGIERQLKTSIFSDDDDAIEALTARIAKREDLAAEYNKINRAWRKYKGDTSAMVAAGMVSEKLAAQMKRTMELAPWLGKPLDATNLRASIRRDKKRLAELMKKRTDRPLLAGPSCGSGPAMEGAMTKAEMAKYLTDALFPADEGDTQRKRNYAEMLTKRKKADLEVLIPLAEKVFAQRGSDAKR